MRKGKNRGPDLEAAYALRTPEDSRRLYADWADSYDRGFAADMDYRLHDIVAQEFADLGGVAPVLDLGAGTGLAGQALHRLGIAPVDATDISPDMLRVAKGKGIYRHVFAADLTDRLGVASGGYPGVISSGTFTNGHVGPAALDEVLRVTAPGGLVVLSVNVRHWAAAGFAGKLAALAPQIDALRQPERHIYGPGADPAHRDDTAFIVSFRKTG